MYFLGVWVWYLIGDTRSEDQKLRRKKASIVQEANKAVQVILE